MVRVYFEVRTGDGVTPDFEGQEFHDLTQARSEADAALRELLAEEIFAAVPLQPRSFAIHDEAGQLLAVVRLTATLDKQEHCPANLEHPHPSSR
jgi:hypothetical protein